MSPDARYYRLLVTHSSTGTTEARGAAVDRRIVALESKALRITSTLRDMSVKARQGYD